MRVAAIYDIHGNLPALEAVLDDIARAGVDQIIVGGDVVPGPLPRETLARLRELDIPTQFIHGNGELAVLAQIEATDPDRVTYWGTTSGAPLPEPHREVLRWTARQLQPQDAVLMASWPRTVSLEIDGVGAVLFCHATPRNETEIFTRATHADRLQPVFDGVAEAVVVCGHTHMQFDRVVDRVRVVNAGSVGMPFGRAGAYWLLLGSDIQLRRTEYDLGKAAERIRATRYPQAEDFAARFVLQPPSEADMIRVFAPAELT
jgi:predicted phosphodiesterase